MSDQHPLAEPRPLLGVEPQVATSAATTTVLRVAVRNTADAARVLAVSAVGVDAGWVDGTQRTAALAPGETGIVELRLTPPLGTLPARYPLILAAQALDPETGRPTSASTGTAETVLVVDPRSQLSVDIEPREMRMIASGRFTVLVRNGGTAPAKVHLLLKSSAHVTFTLGREVKVGPGQTARVRGRARVRKPSLLGGRMNHSYTLTARGTETVKHVSGTVAQRSAVGPTALKILMLVVVLAVWVGAAVVLIPALSERIKSSSEESASEVSPGAEEEAADAGADPAAAGGDDAGDAAGGQAGGPGDEEPELQLSGTVAGEDPDDVTVRLEPTSLVDEEAQGGVGVGVDSAVLDGTGMRLSSAFVRGSARDRETPDRSVVTAGDGAWAFPAVRAPGYYLVTFSKPGYQTQRFVVDSTSEAAAQPLEVDLAPGDGALSGRVTGPGGKPVGGSTITITDGISTITTSSNSEGDIGAWSIDGLSSPSTYVVSATKHGMSSEARAVTLAAGGTGSANLVLVDGVATLTGRVTDADDSGVGGSTVTVTDGTGDVRTATTLTQQPRGFYSIPGLPAPGDYTVTVTGSGFQSQTRQLHLNVGQSTAKRDVSLNSATGSLSGRIFIGDRDHGLENAGMTLSNAEHTYKTTSTRTKNLGDYTFTGVVPGTYILKTQYFGQVTDHVSVEIEAGVPERSFDRVLKEESGAGLPATSTLTGSVIDAQTLQDVSTCEPVDGEADVFEPCLTASLTDSGVVRGGKTTDSTTYTTAFGPGEAYELPDPETSPGQGLRPGLHRVTITAPGYETAQVEVEVGQAGQIEAPLTQIFQAPRVTGTLTAATSADPSMPAAPSTTSCVWVVRSGAAPADCQSSIDDGTCRPGSAPYSGTGGESGTAARWCAASAADGSYTVQVPTQGTYSLVIDPVDPEWAAPDPRSVELGQGETEQQDATLNRFGMVRLSVYAPASNDVLQLTPDLQVSTKGTLAIPTIPLTDAGGATLIRGLGNLDQYTFSAAASVEVDGGLASVSGKLSVAVPYNDVRDEVLRLTDRVPFYLGQVQGQFDDDLVRVPGASLTVRAATSFGPDDQPVYPTTDLAITTDRVGCFSISSLAPATRAGTDCDAPGTREAGVELTGTGWPSYAGLSQPISSAHAAVVTVSAPGYDPLPASAQTSRPFRTDGGVTKFVLTPSAIPFTVRAGLNPSPRTGSAVPDWDAATVTVLDKPAQAGDITVGVSAGTDPEEGVLSWLDSGVGTAEKIRPGTYQVAISGVPGWEDDVATLVCRTGATACEVPDPLQLKQKGAVRLTVLGTDEAPVVGAVVTLQSGAQESRPTVAGGVVEFDRLTPGDGSATAAHLFRVRAAGYVFGTTSLTPTATDAVRISCTDPGAAGTPSTGTEIVIRPGLTTACTIRLQQRLTTIEGHLTGVLAAEPPTPDLVAPAGAATELLGGHEVELLHCTDTTCAQTDSRLSQVTPLADGIQNGGAFSFGGSVETEALVPGTYLLRVPTVPAGYSRPTTGRQNGQVITVAPVTGTGDGVVEIDALLYAQQVDFDVRITDQHNLPVAGATVRIASTATGASEGPGTVPSSSPSPGRYRFTGVQPGRWYVYATAEGMRPTTSELHVIGSAAISAQQTVDFPVFRAGASVAGVTTTTVGATPTNLVGVSVALTCSTAAGALRPPAANCPDSGPARSTDQQPLTTTSASVATGSLPVAGYQFASVASGDYVATFSKPGYQTTTRPVSVRSDPVTGADATLGPVSRPVTVTVTPSHPSPGLSGIEVQLRPRSGTVGQALSGTISTVGTDIVASFTQVPWGCWEVAVLLPDGHHGELGPVTGSPPAGDLSCVANSLVVPADATTDELATPIEVSRTLQESQLTVAMVVSTLWQGHVPPTPTITIEGTSTSGATVERSFEATSSDAWLPPGSYTVGLSLPESEAAFWTVPDPRPITLAADATWAESITVTELGIPVQVSIPSLTSGVADLLVSPGTGQQATYVPSSAGAPELTVTGAPEGGTTTLVLPRGRWVIEGAWTAGPGAVEIDVQGPVGSPVVLARATP